MTKEEVQKLWEEYVKASDENEEAALKMRSAYRAYEKADRKLREKNETPS